MPINKDKLEAREKAAQSRPDFIRPESWRYKRLDTTWRKPKGIDVISAKDLINMV